jgi:hypothetical protein
MIRIYLILAVTAVSLLLAAFATGMAASASPRVEVRAWGGVHLATSLTTVIAVMGIHSLIYTYFIATVRWVKEVSLAYDLSDWLLGQARRNKGRASRFIMGGVVAVAAAAWTGAAVDTRGAAFAPWHLAAASFALGFNAVAFFIEYAGVVAHQRLLAELNVQADRVRASRRDESPSDDATSS